MACGFHTLGVKAQQKFEGSADKCCLLAFIDGPPVSDFVGNL